MKHGEILLWIALAAALVLSPSAGFSQAQPTSTRIPQQIVVNGQVVSGASVTAAGGQLQSFSCPSPQQYTTADGSSQGWACYELTTGVWLLNALPPTPAPQAVSAPATVSKASSPPTYSPRRSPPPVSNQRPTVIYEPPPVVIYTRPAPAVVIYRAPPPYPGIILNPRYSRDYGRPYGRRR